MAVGVSWGGFDGGEVRIELRRGGNRRVGLAVVSWMQGVAWSKTCSADPRRLDFSEAADGFASAGGSHWLCRVFVLK